MSVKLEICENTVTALLSGEIDHHNAPEIRERIDECVIKKQPDKLVLDFEKVSFMDSSGIGLVMGRYRLVQDKGCKIAVMNLSQHAFKVMKLAGLEKIVILKKKPREADKNESA